MRKIFSAGLWGAAIIFFIILLSPIQITNYDAKVVVYGAGFTIIPILWCKLLLGTLSNDEEQLHAGHYAFSILTGVVAVPFCFFFWMALVMIGRIEDRVLFKSHYFSNTTIEVSHLDGGAWDSGNANYTTEINIKLLSGVSWVTEIDTTTINKENWIRVFQ